MYPLKQDQISFLSNNQKQDPILILHIPLTPSQFFVVPVASDTQTAIKRFRAQEKKGALYVFLTSFGLNKRLVDRVKDEEALVGAIDEILKTGVGGIMTDYPKRIGNIMQGLIRDRESSA